MKAPKKPDFAKGIEREDLEKLCIEWGKYSTENPNDENISIWFRLTDWLNLMKFADKTEKEAVKMEACSIRDLHLEILQLNQRIAYLKSELDVSEDDYSASKYEDKIEELEIELEKVKDEHDSIKEDFWERDVPIGYKNFWLFTTMR